MSTHTKASDFFVAGGTMRPDTPSYVKRPADAELFNQVLAGEYCYVLTPRQMGKSSLMIRTKHRLQAEGVRTAIIDLTEMDRVVGRTAGRTADIWYLDLLIELANELDLSVDAEAWWQARASLGQVRRFVNFLRDVVLTEITDHVVIFIDEIDITLNLDFSDGFFAAIRAMYNARAKNPAFNRLTFVLIGVATPSDLTKDQTRTPFNIGQAIDLQELSRADAQVLQAGWSEIESDQRGAILERIFYWTDGHPYLTQKLCLAVAESKDERWTDERIDELVESLFLSEETRKESNLKFVRDRILTYPQSRQLLALYRQVYKGKGIGDDERSPIQSQLKLSGLVKAEDGVLRVRNEIYRHVFDLAWVKEHTAINWAPIVAVISVFTTLLAVGAILYNAWVGIQIDSCIANFYQTNAPEERLTHLARIFQLQGLFGPTDYDYKARELFYGLSRGEQLALFYDVDVHGVADSDLIEVVSGLYVTLADVDGTGSTTPFLEAMVRALGHLDETEETTRLRDEVNTWLRGRDLARQSQYNDALVEYNRAIELNGDNPATRYERARVFIELSEYQQALSDLDQVIAIARRSPVPTPTPAPSISAPTASPVLTMVSTPTSGMVITPTTPAGTPTPTTTPVPVPIISEFGNTGQMISAVRNLIYDSPGLVGFLASAPGLEYPNLRESGLLGEFGLLDTFTYLVRVQDQDTGEAIEGAHVTITIGGDIAPVDDVTGNDGIAMITIDSSRAGKLGWLIVTKPGYEEYKKHINLTQDALPDFVQLVPASSQTATATKPPTHAPAETPTSTPSPTSTPPIATATPLLLTIATPTRVPQAVPPELIAPAQGLTYKNPNPFQWSGSLGAGQSYQVTLYHPESGIVIQSELLTTQSWSADLPAEQFGAWHWRVSVVADGIQVATSSEWMFWFQPFGGEEPPATTGPIPTYTAPP